jgi:hypothetical protein
MWFEGQYTPIHKKMASGTPAGATALALQIREGKLMEQAYPSSCCLWSLT